MSFNLGRTILDGLKNTFVNIPLDALQAEGVPSSTTVLYGDGLWKQPILVAPVSPAYDQSAVSAASGTLTSGTPFSWRSGVSTGGAWGIVEIIGGAGSGNMTLAADVEVTWGGIPMVSKGHVYDDNVSTFGWSWVFELDGIPDGDSLIVVTPTQSGKNFVGYGMSFSYTNVASTGALQTAFGVGNPSLTVAAAHTNDIVWGSLYTAATAQSAQTGFTARQHTPAILFAYAGDTTGVSSATFGATSSTVAWSAVGLDLIAAVNPLTAKEDTANKNQANGYAGLDGTGKVASAQLPSTDVIAEGSTNRYYTNARVDAEIPAATHAATSKTTPVDADEMPIADSAASFGLKRLTWANLKAAIKSYYDSATSILTNKDLTSGTNTFPTFNQSTTGNAATATKLATARNLDGQPFDGTTNIPIVAPATHAATSKGTPVDADELPLADSAASFGLKKLTWANTKAALDARYEPLEQFAILPSAYTLASSTALQQLFNNTTNGALTLPVGDYFFECDFALSALSATSGYFSFGFGGTAVIAQSWTSIATKGTSSGTIIGATANNSAVVLANTNTNGTATIRGRITVTTAGTIIPSISLSVAAAAIVAAGAIFRITSVNSTASQAGAWS